ncbi:TerD family protein, partial [Streptomyces durbertensis]
MTAELVRGQNHALPESRLEIRISAGDPVLAGAVLVDATGRTTDAALVAHPGAPNLPGLECSRQAAAFHRLAVDLQALPAGVEQARVLLALPQGVGGPLSFGSLAAPFIAVTGLDGTEIASYTIVGLGSESAVIAVELYRRQGTWKVRAVGQGYADGLAALLADQGLGESEQLAERIHEAVAGGMARSLAAPPGRGAGRGAAGHGPAGVPDPDRDTEPTGAAPAGPAPTGAAAGGSGSPAGGDPRQAPTQGDTGRVDYRHPRRQTTA